MKNTILFAAIMVLLFSCRKSQEPTVVTNDTMAVEGSWNAGYLNGWIRVTVDAACNFSMTIPVIVKKESNAAPQVMDLVMKGLCVLTDAGYELKSASMEIEGQAGNAELREIRGLLCRALEGVEIGLQKKEADGKVKAAVITARDGRIVMYRTEDK